MFLCGVIAWFAACAQAGPEGYPRLEAPEAVYQVARQRATGEAYNDAAVVGTPIRFFIDVRCDSLEIDPSSLRHHINAAASKGASEWYVPIFADSILDGLMLVTRYEAGGDFRYSGYRPASYLGLSVLEINDYWVKQRGYHPVIIECGYNTMLHIPELGPNNLTHFATTVLPRDEAPGVKKCRFHKLVIQKGIADNSKKITELWNEYVESLKSDAPQEGLGKIQSMPSDFTTVDSLETGIEWLKNNRSGKR